MMCRVRCYAIVLALLCLSLVVDLSVTQSCGKRKVVDFLIVNGDEAKDGYWPWHAAIFHNNGRFFAYECGGTILDYDTVLTAAHCVITPTGIIARRRVIVYAGRHRLSVAGNRVQEHQVLEFIVHPEYSIGSIGHDIALVRLTSDIMYTDYIQPICLWNRGEDLNEIIGSRGMLIGFGIDETGIVSDILREASIPVVSHYTCIESNRIVFGQLLTSNMFCAGNRDGISACNGDSGGGLFFNYNDTWFIRGVVSFTKLRQHENYCDTMEYTAFTDVAKYLRWIEQHIRRTAGGQPTMSGVDGNRKIEMPPMAVRNDTEQSLIPTIINGWKLKEQQTLRTDGQLNATIGLLPISTRNDTDESLLPTFVNQWEQTEPHIRGTFRPRRVIFGLRPMYKLSNDFLGYLEPTLIGVDVNHKINLLPMSTCGVNQLEQEPYNLFQFGYPWLAQLVWGEWITFCEATLISDLYLISSANCADSINDTIAEPFVRLGATECHEKWIKKEECSLKIQTIRIESVIKHPYHHRENLDDIALIRLQNRADTSQINVKPICLPVTRELRKNDIPPYILTSWFRGAFGRYLYSTLHDSISFLECLKFLREVSTNQKCIMKKNATWDGSCPFFRYGAPLQLVQQVQGNSRYVLYGVLSLRQKECDLAYPDVYADVAKYIDFILVNLQE